MHRALHAQLDVQAVFKEIMAHWLVVIVSQDINLVQPIKIVSFAIVNASHAITCLTIVLVVP